MTGRPQQVPRRDFVVLMAGGVAALALPSAARVARAQGALPQGTASDSTQAQSSASNVVMDESAYRPIRLPAKAGASPSLTKADVDALEHRIGCACPCTLDVYTCRTTDFSCGISPQMHRDVQRLVAGGYSGDEIISAFVDTYGEQVLMSPKREGFNWAGYVVPFIALGTGAVVLAGLIRRWGARAAAAAPNTPVLVRDNDATPDELRRLEAAVRGEGS